MTGTLGRLAVGCALATLMTATAANAEGLALTALMHPNDVTAFASLIEAYEVEAIGATSSTVGARG